MLGPAGDIPSGRVNSYRREQLRRLGRALRSGGAAGFLRHVLTAIQLRYRVGGLKGVWLLGSLGHGTGRMAQDWDRRARLNARYFVASGDWATDEEFERSGERVVSQDILRGIELLPGATTLEIGCGIGRLLRPMAARGARAIGIDVSPEMVRLARERLTGAPSAEVLLGDGQSLSGVAIGSVDLCYSYVVFQHLPRVDMLVSYFHEVGRVLVPGGLFRFQAQGPARADDPRAVQSGGTWVGIRVSPARLSSLLEEAGLTVLEMTQDRRTDFKELWVTARRESTLEPGRAKATYRRPAAAVPEATGPGRDP